MMVRRGVKLMFAAFCTIALSVLAFRDWQRRYPGPVEMTLAHALWVTERDYSRYYPPGSHESRAVVEALARADPSLRERRFDEFILYRRGLSETSPSSEPVLVLGFDPTAVPAERRNSTPP